MESISIPSLMISKFTMIVTGMQNSIILRYEYVHGLTIIPRMYPVSAVLQAKSS